jgi:hypothetical protein
MNQLLLTELIERTNALINVIKIIVSGKKQKTKNKSLCVMTMIAAI